MTQQCPDSAGPAESGRSFGLNILPDDAAGIAVGDDAAGDASGHDAPRADDYVVPDGHAGHDDNPAANPDVVPNDDRGGLGLAEGKGAVPPGGPKRRAAFAGWKAV